MRYNVTVYLVGINDLGHRALVSTGSVASHELAPGQDIDDWNMPLAAEARRITDQLYKAGCSTARMNVLGLTASENNIAGIEIKVGENCIAEIWAEHNAEPNRA